MAHPLACGKYLKEALNKIMAVDAITEQKNGCAVKQDEKSVLKEWVELLISAGFCALLIYLFIFQVSVVEGPSMLPNFHDNDKLIIDKLAYRFLPINRFDVIVFEAVDLNKPPRRARDYIKRVIGLPGETVKIQNGQLWVNGQKIEEDKHFQKGPYSFPENAQEMSLFGLTLKVPEKYYFVMGDNRGSSHDSRSPGLGFVSEGQVKGLVRIQWWPWERLAWFSRTE
ncbi:MAG: signal peptidase I [Planctomycetota bacterium]